MTEGKLLGRVKITGSIELATGMHIGKSKDTLQIGGIDNPIIRDPFTSEPYIPGSSFKGKMRSFYEKVLISAGDSKFGFDSISIVGGGVTIHRHECPTASVAVDCPVCRLFGANGNKEALTRYIDAKRGNPSPPSDEAEYPTNFPARVAVSDAFLTDDSISTYKGMSELPYAEWKSENTVDRITAAANPRQVERAARGLKFEFRTTYDIKPDRLVLSDLQNLSFALYLVELNGIGGQTSRGYGHIAISDLNLAVNAYQVISTNGELPTFEDEQKTGLGFSAKSLTELRNTLDSDDYACLFMEEYTAALE